MLQALPVQLGLWRGWEQITGSAELHQRKEITLGNIFGKRVEVRVLFSASTLFCGRLCMNLNSFIFLTTF